MAAPLVIAGKVVLQKGLELIHSKYPGGIPGFIATFVLVALFQAYIVIGTVANFMSSFSTGSAVKEDQCLFVNDFAYIDADSDDEGAEESSGDDDTSADPASTDTIVMPLTHVQVNSHYGARSAPKTNQGAGSSNHKGTDYKGTVGTPLYAVADGVVHRAGPVSGLGQRIAIKHVINGKKWYVQYGHTTNATKYVKQGDAVKAGQIVGEIGLTGNTSGAHLHMEVWEIPSMYGPTGSVDPHEWLLHNGALKTAEVDPAEGTLVLTENGLEVPDDLLNDADINQLMIDCNITKPDAGADDGEGVGAGAWGGHKNGQIPPGELCKIETVASVQSARCDAAAAFDEVNKAYKEKFGSYMQITDSYRSLDAQKIVYVAKPGLAAIPGTSNHGWGLALDIASGMPDPTSPTYKWMRENGPNFGWVHPKWARTKAEGGTKPEAWHWEYVGRNSPDKLGTVTEIKAHTKEKANKDYGWGDKEFSCVDALWTRESNWNYKAANPTSSARGIPQAMMSSAFTKNWETNPAAKKYLESPAVQVKWGLSYIKNRYGTPCAALAHSDDKNWY